jgi:hypothetical protein
MFHGGCHGCTQQTKHGIDFCYDCQYFEADWDKPDLNNRPPTEAEIKRKEVKARLDSKQCRVLEWLQ